MVGYILTFLFHPTPFYLCSVADILNISELRVTFYIAWIIEKTIAINCTFNEDEALSNRKSQAMLTKNILQAHPSITITAIKNKSLELDGDSSDNFPDSEFPVDTELVEYDESSMFSEDGESSNFRLVCLRLPANSSSVKGVFLGLFFGF